MWLALARFSTGKFINPAARTVAAFDPDDPSRNDYRHGYDTLLVWGKPWFSGAAGAQALTYLLYNKLSPASSDRPDALVAALLRRLSATTAARAGATRESTRRRSTSVGVRRRQPDQRELRRAARRLGDALRRRRDRRLGRSLPRTHLAPAPGALHLRWAQHPWGAATQGGATREQSGAWSEPFPVLRPEDVPQLLACRARTILRRLRRRRQGPPHRLLPRAHDRSRLPPGNPGFDRGIFYSSIVIDELTRAVEPKPKGARAAELVWEISTWNPYAVWLIKSRVELAPD